MKTLRQMLKSMAWQPSVGGHIAPRHGWVNLDRLDLRVAIQSRKNPTPDAVILRRKGMKLRTVTVIHWLILMLSAVAWCRAQEPNRIEDWPLKKSIIFFYPNGDTLHFYPYEAYIKFQPKPLTLDSLVVLWDEYEKEVHESDVYGMTAECDSAVVFRFEPTFSGFMDFLRRKAKP